MKLLTGKTVLVGTQNFFPLSHARDEAKNSFLCFFTELKNYHLSYSICEHDTIDIAGPSSMQDACHELRNRPRSPWNLCGSVVEHRSVESEGLRFVSSWGIRIFSLSHACNKTNNIFLLVMRMFKFVRYKLLS